MPASSLPLYKESYDTPPRPTLNFLSALSPLATSPPPPKSRLSVIQKLLLRQFSIPACICRINTPFLWFPSFGTPPCLFSNPPPYVVSAPHKLVNCSPVLPDPRLIFLVTVFTAYQSSFCRPPLFRTSFPPFIFLLLRSE